VAMKCPLPLPPWLVSGMVAVQDMLDHCVMQHWGKKAKKKCFKSSGIISQPVYRHRKESPHNCEYKTVTGGVARIEGLGAT